MGSTWEASRIGCEEGIRDLCYFLAADHRQATHQTSGRLSSGIYELRCSFANFFHSIVECSHCLYSYYSLLAFNLFNLFDKVLSLCTVM